MIICIHIASHGWFFFALFLSLSLDRMKKSIKSRKWFGKREKDWGQRGKQSKNQASCNKDRTGFSIIQMYFTIKFIYFLLRSAWTVFLDNLLNFRRTIKRGSFLSVFCLCPQRIKCLMVFYWIQFICVRTQKMQKWRVDSFFIFHHRSALRSTHIAKSEISSASKEFLTFVILNY